ncbi:MAG: Hsp20/alpha crystallin family protein [Nitrosopumilaceae archaeon]
MVKITHGKKFPLLRQDFDPWFESSFSNFPSLFSWFRADPFEDMESRMRNYLSYLNRSLPNIEGEVEKISRDIYCDLDDREDKFVLTADMPGLSKDEITINVLDSEIEISGEHKESKEEKKKGHLRSERSQVRYYRTMTLPEEILGSKVSAKLNNGILTVNIPKKTPKKAQEPVSIKVE